MAEEPSWRIIDVADLPWAHFPWKCRWREQFDASGLESFGEFVATLTPEQIAECEYHRGPDWALAARTAVELVEAGRTSVDDATADELGPSSCTAWAVASFFAEPISVIDDGRQLGNGQHRACALRAAGALRCPILA